MEDDKIHNRLSGYFDQEKETVNRLREKLSDEAASIVHQTQNGLKQGMDTLQTAEESLVRAVREYQVILFIAAVSLVGLMIVGSFLARKLANTEN